jgi:DNA ligase-1
MRRFTELYEALDRTTRTAEKVRLLAGYFREAPPADAAWAVSLLSGRKPIRAVPSKRLRQWVAELSGFPTWMIDECYAAVGDLSETLALLLPPTLTPQVQDEPGQPAEPPPLHELIRDRLLPLPALDETSQRRLVVDTWALLSPAQRFLYHKLISANFRVGVARKLLVRALAEVAGVDQAVMDLRLSGRFNPTVQAMRGLLRGDQTADPARPYPFFLASPLEEDPQNLGDLLDWQVEWKWDGVRAQVIRRAGRCLVWSRGEEMVSEAFPEVVAAASRLPDGCVLDGELLAYDFESDHPLPFNALQRRLNRKRTEPALWQEVPVAFIAYDLMEHEGQDIRSRPLEKRRELLEGLLGPITAEEPTARLSQRLRVRQREELSDLMDRARAYGTEGLMLKRLSSPYRVGRVRGDWWKWKLKPHTVDAVMVYAQQGSGRRANLFSDYTFALWDQGKLVAVTKAYSGLSDQEMRQVDRWVRAHTLQRHGPVRVVEPKLVFEVAFEGVQASDRHRCGLALRFPRMARWRQDKPPEEADELEGLRRLLAQQEKAASG